MLHKDKKFCKICFNHGEPEKVYTSHFTRNNREPYSVVCPTILNNVCLKCFKQGHFTSYCKRK